VVESSGLLNRFSHFSKCKKTNYNLLPAKYLHPIFISLVFTLFHPN
jgi:hypothetical protein